MPFARVAKVFAVRIVLWVQVAAAVVLSTGLRCLLAVANAALPFIVFAGAVLYPFSVVLCHGF